ncbi:MAG: M23 family metallopeptidase [Candidatus Sulfotelmatobacter sp.]
MTRAERIRRLPKTGWGNRLARHLAVLGKQPAPTAFFRYQTQTALHLPFANEWYVYWGGRSAARNKHVLTKDQRFAYDFLILAGGRSRQSYRTSGEANSDYYCFGLPIYAPADGRVVSVENEIFDNAPGEMNAKAALGNYVILDHGCAEFSFLAHLRQRTVAVHYDQWVRSGQMLGQCGNSGNSSEPHLHYHLQNTSVPFEGDGLPAFFSEYVANGKSVAWGEPTARQTVRSQVEFDGE